MPAVTRRDYTGPDDLRAMQSLAQRIWSPSSSVHVGDLAWQRFQHVGREAEWPTVLWEAGAEVVAWGWVSLPGELSLLVDPARPELASEVLGWFEDTATAAELTVTCSTPRSMSSPRWSEAARRTQCRRRAGARRNLAGVPPDGPGPRGVPRRATRRV
ncbi:hypothetical protein OHS18_33205 [Amycolatopsis sp. NBC_00355]|uniref:hypothetical protein n=1 Tax=Amycolatopsis sp. NBC_00355 TaxID=2975957 RepID=UPI002E277382